MATLGKGTLKVGATGAQIDCSGLVNNAKIVPSKSQGDSKTMLDGSVKAGATTYTWALSGSVDVDVDKGAGSLFDLAHTKAGTEVEFEFVPNTADGTTVKGKIVIDPLQLGADNFGDYLSSDFEWAVVGDPVFTYGAHVGP